MSDTLSTLFCDSREIEIGDTKIKVKNVRLGDLPKLIKIAKKLFQSQNKNSSKLDIANAIAEDFDSVIEVFELTTDLEKQTIENLNLGAATIILGEIIKENSDFFQKNVMPLLTGLAEKFQVAKTSGQSKSKN